MEWGMLLWSAESRRRKKRASRVPLIRVKVGQAKHMVVQLRQRNALIKLLEGRYAIFTVSPLLIEALLSVHDLT